MKDAGADAVLVKPCLPEILLDEIHRVIAISLDLRRRGDEARATAAARLEHAMDVVERSKIANEKSHKTLARSHARGQTTTPPLHPPELICPQCDGALTFEYSHIGGVSALHSEQWDYFNCRAGCGTFQYRHRTRKLRRV